MRTKRTRPIRGDYFLTIPRITHEGRILEIKVKLSQVIVTDLGPAKKRGRVGEIHEAKTDTVYARGAEYLPGSPGSDAPPSAGEMERGSVDGEEGKQGPVTDEHTGERV